MIRISAGNLMNSIPLPADTVGIAIISTAGAVVSQAWPTSAHLVSFHSTISPYVNFYSTAVNIPSTNSTGTTASSGINVLLDTGRPHLYQITSTGSYSITAATSGVVSMEFWRK